MRTRIKPFMFVLALLLASGTAAAQQIQPDARVLAAYTNQRNSTLYIESVTANGLVTGYFINRAQGFRCRDTAYPVTGWLYGRAITFTVRWQNTAEDCQSVTGWTGYFSADFSTLTTNWLLSVSGSTTILNGQDQFRRTVARRSESLLEPGTRP